MLVPELSQRSQLFLPGRPQGRRLKWDSRAGKSNNWRTEGAESELEAGLVYFGMYPGVAGLALGPASQHLGKIRETLDTLFEPQDGPLKTGNRSFYGRERFFVPMESFKDEH